MSRRNWNTEELILAMELYRRIGPGKSTTHEDVIELAATIGRSPGSVIAKLENFASCDPVQRARGRKGLTNGGQADREIWERYFGKWDELWLGVQEARARLSGKSLESLLAEEQDAQSEIVFPGTLANFPTEGVTREMVVKVRATQYAFRKHILAIYNNRCCLTGISERGLLVASHIVPWSEDISNRMNPSNGLCLNALHDRAFDRYLITVVKLNTRNRYEVRFSRRFNETPLSQSMNSYFLSVKDLSVNVPDMGAPGVEFLLRHNAKFEELESNL